MRRLKNVENSREVRRVWKRRFCVEDVQSEFGIDRKTAVLVLRTLGVVDPERFELPPPPEEDLRRIALIDALLEAAPYLASDELAAVCADARGLSISGSRARWRVRPVKERRAA